MKVSSTSWSCFLILTIMYYIQIWEPWGAVTISVVQQNFCVSCASNITTLLTTHLFFVHEISLICLQLWSVAVAYLKSMWRRLWVSLTLECLWGWCRCFLFHRCWIRLLGFSFRLFGLLRYFWQWRDLQGFDLSLKIKILNYCTTEAQTAAWMNLV